MYKCPKCGNGRFSVVAHVFQDWIVDEQGEWIQTTDDCSEVIHFPDSVDIWECTECHYDSEGSAFKTV